MSAAPVSASGNTLGDYAGCEVNGLIAPQIQFQLMLPMQNYQGKYLQLGCGGYCGSDTLSSPAASYGCTPVTTGQFAEATDNEGHSGAVFSGAFGSDLNLRVDFGYASEHALAVTAKAIIAAFYGQRPASRHDDGCSQGGHEGLLEAQRYPADFNGIIAGAPASILTPLNIFYQGWNTLANTGPDGQPDPDRGRPGPAARGGGQRLRCPGQNERRADRRPVRLSLEPAGHPVRGRTDVYRREVLPSPLPRRPPLQALRRADDQHRAGCCTQVGKLRGSEENWLGWIVPASGPESAWIDWGIATQTIKYLMGTGADPSLTINDIQFTSAYFQKLMKETAGIYDATDPDLTAFKNDGGKLILWQGLADPAISPVGTIAYYQAVENYMGGATATNAFARLFMLPGVSHCSGGDGPDSFNGLGALVNWVEKGQAPSVIITSKVTNGKVTATRPVFQYPLIAVDTTGGPVPRRPITRHSSPRCPSTPTSGAQAASAPATAGRLGRRRVGLPPRKSRSSVSTRAARVQSDAVRRKRTSQNAPAAESAARHSLPGSEALGVV